MVTLLQTGTLQEIGIKSLVGYLEFHNIPVRAIYLNKCNKLSEQAIEKNYGDCCQFVIGWIFPMSKDLNILLPLINAIKNKIFP